MAVAKRIRAARHYQRADAPIKLLRDKAIAPVARGFSAGFRTLGEMVHVTTVIGELRRGQNPAKHAINWHHYREALRAPFGLLARVYHEGAELGARKINGSFAAAGRKVRYRKYVSLIAKPVIVTRYQVKSGAVSSKHEPNVVYIDPRIPARFWPFLAVHELVERHYMVDLGYDYDTAHTQYATPAERAAVEAAGMNWEHYTHEMDGYLEVIEHEHVTNPPPDPHIDPEAAVADGHHHSHNKGVSGGRGRGAGDRTRGIEKASADQFSFDSLSQGTQDRLREAQDALIQQLEADARETIDTIIREGEMNGTGLDMVAGDIRDFIGLTDTQAQAVMNYERMLGELDPQALERSLRNTAYDASLQDAIDSGVDLSDLAIQNMVDDYAENYLDYRANAIATTEASRAANWGLHDAYRQAVDRGALSAEAITRNWQLGPNPCPICESIPDSNPDGVGIDEDFDSDDGPISDAPVHTHCGCSVEYVTDLSLVPDDGGEDDEGESDEGEEA